MKSYKLPVFKTRLVRDGALKVAEPKTETPGHVASIARDFLRGADKEHFLAVFLDACNKPVGIHTVSIGTLTASLVHPREVFKPAILAGCAGVVIVHNHPSGDPNPSSEDRMTTRRLVQAGQLLGLPVLDHVIITTHRHFSFREKGLMD